jgi:hypothetical protein
MVLSTAASARSDRELLTCVSTGYKTESSRVTSEYFGHHLMLTKVITLPNIIQVHTTDGYDPNTYTPKQNLSDRVDCEGVLKP